MKTKNQITLELYLTVTRTGLVIAITGCTLIFPNLNSITEMGNAKTAIHLNIAIGMLSLSVIIGLFNIFIIAIRPKEILSKDKRVIAIQFGALIIATYMFYLISVSRI